MTNTMTALNPYYDLRSQNRRICLLITGKNRQKSLNLPCLRKLISGFISSLSRINTRAIVNFRAVREEFSLRKLGLKYQARTGKINRQITGISGKNRQVSGKKWLPKLFYTNKYN